MYLPLKCTFWKGRRGQTQYLLSCAYLSPRASELCFHFRNRVTVTLNKNKNFLSVVSTLSPASASLWAFVSSRCLFHFVEESQMLIEIAVGCAKNPFRVPQELGPC